MAEIRVGGKTKVVHVPAVSSTPPPDVAAAIARFLDAPDPLRETIHRILLEHEVDADGFWQCSCDEISGDRLDHLADVLFDAVEDCWADD